tara:strand:- start:4584 stop:5732 length:1149 start_codon:yes stop_codon:yes gene_type:complete
MNYIHRNKDVVLGKDDLEDLYTFKDFPVFMGCVESKADEDVKADMSWKISPTSGVIQLNPILPLEVVYATSHGSGTVGDAWEKHHKSFSEFVCKYKPTNVLEIGGLHGELAKNCLDINSNLKWTIIEPNPSVPKNLPIKVIKGFFDNNFQSNENFDTIIHSHVLEHIYDPNEFMSNKSLFMNVGDILIFSIPNLRSMLKSKWTNSINFEHTIYFTAPYVEYFLKKYGFEITEKYSHQMDGKDHSLFYSAKKTSLPSNLPKLCKCLYKTNKKVFTEYIDFYLNDVNQINKLIKSQSKPVYLFGAHIFSQYLLAFGLNEKDLVCVLDNDSKKENKRLYGTNLISHSPKILKDVDEALVILRAGVYDKEIKEDIKNNINPKIKFI